LHDERAALHDERAALHDERAALHDELTALHDELAALHDELAALHDELAALHPGGMQENSPGQVRYCGRRPGLLPKESLSPVGAQRSVTEIGRSS
jgi:hypothetical protein